jgi:hypothetical protein
MATQEQQNPIGNTKLLQYLNEMLSVENAAIERLQSRIEETSMPNAKQQLQHHLEETKVTLLDRLYLLIISSDGVSQINPILYAAVL